MPENIHGNSKYKPELKEKTRNFCLLTNATNEQLAEYIGVSVQTVYTWFKEHPDFLESVKEGHVKTRSLPRGYGIGSVHSTSTML